jgi:hypothetical protein
MSARPLLSQLNLWEAHERTCLDLLGRALALLAGDPGGEVEDDLNRQLYRCIIRATQEAARSGTQNLPVVVPEGRNPPVGSDAVRAKREHKIPDFYWPVVDHQEPDAARAARQFAVECKRLTAPTRADWVFTEQYVVAGVLRFMREEHGYGKDSASGAMVGYLQDMTLDNALREVNACGGEHALPPLQRRRTIRDGAELNHDLERPFPESPFRLLHLWVRMAGYDVADVDHVLRTGEPPERPADGPEARETAANGAASEEA